MSNSNNYHHHQPQIIQNAPAPKIIFNNPGSSSHLKKSSRIISFPQGQVPHPVPSSQYSY